jgi:hypothetical protein
MSARIAAHSSPGPPVLLRGGTEGQHVKRSTKNIHVVPIL